MTKKDIFIKTGYWLGIVADGLWAVILASPKLYGIATGTPGFNPDLQIRQLLWVAAILMSGWTILLIWGVMKPVERRFVILLTAFVVLGLFVVAVIGFLSGKSALIWVLLKLPVLFISMIISFFLSEKAAKNDE